jgi:hypothetical protein
MRVARQPSRFRGAGEDEDSTEPLPPCEIALLFATNLEAEDFASSLQGRVTTRCASFVEHAGGSRGEAWWWPRRERGAGVRTSG